MTLNNNELWNNDESDYSEQQDQNKPRAYRVDDDDNLEEKDLKRTYLFGDSKVKSTQAPGMEGQGMGGEHFGENNLTPSGDDQANPSQNAGYDNAYFRRTQPSEEHPENSNFVAQDQQGKTGDTSGQTNIPGPNELPDQQKVGEEKQKQTPNPQQDYREGTADNDGQKSDQSKNTTDRSSANAEKEHIET
ncbi:MAG: hypothetical protein JWP78_585 [Mucilaginibacter sp.]|jgi:hypothetical protein|nr:hypothetical protein [Mucilaginibacter sp.]